MMEQRLGEERVAAAVPPHVDDEPGRAAVLDEADSRSQNAANVSAG